jgi:hypothetical protein
MPVRITGIHYGRWIVLDEYAAVRLRPPKKLNVVPTLTGTERHEGQEKEGG